MVVTNIYLTVATTRTQNAKLRASDVSQSVEVSASNSRSPSIPTDATVGNNFDGNLLNQLPVQNRDNPTALFTLQPGIADDAVTGARTDQSYVTVDGLDVNDISLSEEHSSSLRIRQWTPWRSFAPPSAESWSAPAPAAAAGFNW